MITIMVRVDTANSRMSTKAKFDSEQDDTDTQLHISTRANSNHKPDTQLMITP